MEGGFVALFEPLHLVLSFKKVEFGHVKCLGPWARVVLLDGARFRSVEPLWQFGFEISGLLVALRPPHHTQYWSTTSTSSFLVSCSYSACVRNIVSFHPKITCELSVPISQFATDYMTSWNQHDWELNGQVSILPLIFAFVCNVVGTLVYADVWNRILVLKLPGQIFNDGSTEFTDTTRQGLLAFLWRVLRDVEWVYKRNECWLRYLTDY